MHGSEDGVPLLNLDEDPDTEDSSDPGRTSAQRTAHLIAHAMDQAAEALGHISEAELSDRLEVACRRMAGALVAVARELPETPAACEGLLHLLPTPRGGPAGGEAAELPEQWQPPLSAEDVCLLAQAARCVLMDLSSALEEISREEVEELAEAGLAVAQIATTAGQAVARQLKDAVDNDEGGTVLIEDLDDPAGAAVGGAGAGSVRIHLSSQRWLWLPLWPRLVAWVEKPAVPSALLRLSLPSPPPAYTAAALVLLLLFWPLTLGVSALAIAVSLWVLLFALPCLLLADVVLQWLYDSSRSRVDGLVEGAVQICRLVFVTGRLALRRGVRFARAQVQRALGERTLAEAAREALEDPWATLDTSARFAARTAQGLLHTAAAAATGLPPVSEWSARLRGLLESLWPMPSVVAARL